MSFFFFSPLSSLDAEYLLHESPTIFLFHFPPVQQVPLMPDGCHVVLVSSFPLHPPDLTSEFLISFLGSSRVF